MTDHVLNQWLEAAAAGVSQLWNPVGIEASQSSLKLTIDCV
jgi:hypothetical protein